MLTQFERLQAAFKVDGYYNPPDCMPHTEKTTEAAFSKARAECVMHLKKSLLDVEAMTVDEFLAGRRGR